MLKITRLEDTIAKPSPIYNLFNVVKNFHYIMNMRGYSYNPRDEVFDSDKSTGEQLELFTSMYKSEIVRFNKEKESRRETDRKLDSRKIENFEQGLDEIGSGLIAVYQNENSEEIYTFFSVPEKAGIELGSAVVKMKGKKKKTYGHRLCILSRPGEVQTGEEDINIRGVIEILHYQQLLVNPLEHYRCPSAVHVLTKKEQAKFEQNELIQEGFVPQSISVADPLCIFLNAKVGQVIRFINTSVYSGQLTNKVGYRKVK